MWGVTYSKSPKIDYTVLFTHHIGQLSVLIFGIIILASLSHQFLKFKKYSRSDLMRTDKKKMSDFYSVNYSMTVILSTLLFYLLGSITVSSLSPKEYEKFQENSVVSSHKILNSGDFSGGKNVISSDRSYKQVELLWGEQNKVPQCLSWCKETLGKNFTNRTIVIKKLTGGDLPISDINKQLVKYYNLEPVVSSSHKSNKPYLLSDDSMLKTSPMIHGGSRDLLNSTYSGSLYKDKNNIVYHCSVLIDPVVKNTVGEPASIRINKVACLNNLDTIKIVHMH